MIPTSGQNPDPIDQVKFQYERLRAEILHNDTIAVQILGGVTLIVSAATGIVFNKDISNLYKIMILSSSLYLAFAGMKQSLARVRSTFLLASYMRRYLEPLTEHIKWETRLKEFRLIDEKSDNYPLSNILSTYSFIAGANILMILNYFIISISFSIKEPLLRDSPKFGFLKLGHISILFTITSVLVAFWMIFIWRKEYRKYIDCKESIFKPTWEGVDKVVPTFIPSQTAASSETTQTGDVTSTDERL